MEDMKNRNWQPDLEPLVREAGRILLSFWGTKLTHTFKGIYGFATEADLASEKYLIAALHKLFPQASICAEENGNYGSPSSDYQWVIDPLDGTTNFAHGLSHFCISVALCYQDRPIVGIIYNPMADELYYAQEGKGAFLNGQKLAVTEVKETREVLVACSLPYGSRKKFDTLKLIEKVVQHGYGVRHYGAAALDLAYVAAGRFDGLVLVGLSWWDVAAGAVLISEAGGMITDFSGEPLSSDYSDCLAGGKSVFEGLKSILGRNIK
jgi:myo-inositol-1(or 4)-monophosphatase